MINTKKEIMETLSMVISEVGYTPKAVVNETLNISYDGLTYVPETSETPSDGWCAPVFNLDFLAKELENGDMTMGDIVAYSINIMKQDTTSIYDRFKNNYDWETAKHNLRIVICSADVNKDLLEHCIFKQVEDLAIVPLLKIDIEEETDEEAEGYCSVPKTMRHLWNVTEEEVIDTALSCSVDNEEPCFVNIFDPGFLFEAIKGIKPILTPEFKENFQNAHLVCLTNKNGNYGAAVIFYPGLLKKVYEYLGEPFYILPSSVHEVMICSMVREERSVEELKEMIVSVNTIAVSESEKLADSVYCYDGTFKKLL